MRLIITYFLIFLSITSQAFILEGKQDSSDRSYVAVLEVPMGYQFWYCKQGASNCTNLGPKEVYTKNDLDKLIKKEKLVAVGGTAAAIASGLFGVWWGSYLGFAVLFPVLSNVPAISVNAAAATSMIGGAVGVAAITDMGISSFFHRLSPIDRVKGAYTLHQVQTDKHKTVPNVHEFALWLDDVLSN